MSVSSWSIRGSLVLAVLIAPAPPADAAPAGREPRVLALLSQDAEPFQQVLAGFKAALERAGLQPRVETVALRGDTAAAASPLERARKGEADLVLALGSLATRAAVEGAAPLPIVAGMVLDASDLRRSRNATGVVLEFPVETEFRWLQRVLPGQKKVAVLFNAAENKDRIEAAGRAARALGLALDARPLETPKDLPGALDAIAGEADVLWGTADEIVLTPQTARPILLFSLRHRIPFVGLSLTWVKAGALYALDRDYADIGAQCGEMAARILQGAAASSLPPVGPRKVVYSINMKTARMLRIDVPGPIVQGARMVVE